MGQWNPTIPSERTPELVNYEEFYGLAFTNATHSWGKIEVDDRRIVINSWYTPRSQETVLVVHGYYDHAGVMARLIGHLLGAGYAVVIYDQPGHGLSDGEPAAINSFVEYSRVFEAVVSNLEETVSMPKPWHIVAHSMGGGLVAERILRKGLSPFDRIVLMAPLVRSAHWGTSRFGLSIGRHFSDSVPRVFRRNTSDEAFMEFVKNDPLQARRQSLRWATALGAWQKRFKKLDPRDTPVLILQGLEDTTVDVGYNLKILKKKFPESRIIRFESLGHQLMNEIAPQRTKVLKAVTTYLEGEGEQE